MEFDIGNVITLAVIVCGFACQWGSVSARLKTLEKKMDKHNDLVIKVAENAASAKSAHHRIDELRKDI